MTVLDTGTFRLSGGPVTLIEDGTSVRGRGKRHTQYLRVHSRSRLEQACLGYFIHALKSALPARFVPGRQSVRLRMISWRFHKSQKWKPIDGWSSGELWSHGTGDLAVYLAVLSAVPGAALLTTSGAFRTGCKQAM